MTIKKRLFNCWLSPIPIVCFQARGSIEKWLQTECQLSQTAEAVSWSRRLTVSCIRVPLFGFQRHERGSLAGFAPFGSSNSVRPFDEDGSRSLVPLRGLFVSFSWRGPCLRQRGNSRLRTWFSLLEYAAVFFIFRQARPERRANDVHSLPLCPEHDRQDGR